MTIAVGSTIAASVGSASGVGTAFGVGDAIVVTNYDELVAALARSEPILISDKSIQAILSTAAVIWALASGLVLGDRVVDAVKDAVNHAISEQYRVSIDADVSLEIKKWGLLHLKGKVVLTPPRQP